jgi:ornithine carbamoyltransferase
MPDLRQRSFLKESDFTAAEFGYLLDFAAQLKAAKAAGTEEPRLRGKNIALLFEKTSTRTRCAFEVAAADQGAHTTYLDPAGSQVGHKESVADTARVLGRMFDAIQYRGNEQETVETLAGHAGVPVYNGLTNEWHPTQMLADFLTMREHSGKADSELKFAYLGDARFNMGRSLLVTGALLGCDVRLVCPSQMAPPADVVELARTLADASGAKLTITDDVATGVRDVDFVHTDVWVSMGEPKEVWADRVNLLRGFQVNDSVMAATKNPAAKFMHCLPAFHDASTITGAEVMEATGMPDGLEVTHSVFESAASVVFDQAENRMHTIKALLVATLGT